MVYPLINVFYNRTSIYDKHLNEKQYLTPESTEIIFGRGSAPEPTEGAHGAPTDNLVAWKAS